MNKKILMCGLLTGGHIYPLYALKNSFPDDEITYLVIKDSLDSKIINDCNKIEIKAKKSIKENLFNKEFYKEIKRLKSLLNSFDIYFSSGGLSTFILSFFVKNKSWYLFEQNAILGDANKFFALKAKKIFLAYKINSIFNYKCLEIGNPSYLRFNNKAKYKNKVIFVFGSLSSLTMVEKTINYFLSVFFIKELEYILVCKDVKIKLDKNIKVVSYINLEEYLDESNIFISRCGGSTSYELLKYKMKVLFVPSPFVKHNHQEKNAIYLNKHFNYPYLKEKDYTSLNIRKEILHLKKFKVENKITLDTLQLIKDSLDEDL